MIEWDKAIAYNQKQYAAGAFTDRQIAKLVAAWQATHDLTADGMCGPITQASLDNLVAEGPPDDGEDYWPMWDGPLDEDAQPSKRSEVYAFFGNPGVGTADADWMSENIITVRDLPGIPSRWYFQVNKHIEPYMREALRRALISSPYRIERAGCYVFRHLRHDPSRALSYHSWGIAVDFDSNRNYSKTYRDKANAPKPWDDEWMKLWPNGVDKAFVDAFESCGFAWGGDWDGDRQEGDHTYIDPMHFEWVDRS